MTLQWTPGTKGINSKTERPVHVISNFIRVGPSKVHKIRNNTCDLKHMRSKQGSILN